MFKFLRKTLLYIALAPYAIVGLGMACNHAVLIANHDTYPVRINPVKLQDWVNRGTRITVSEGTTYVDDYHIVMTDKTHLNWLADIFDEKIGIISIGDMLLDLGNGAMPFTPFIWIGAILRKLTAE